MLTVRFPSGVAVQYNAAGYLSYPGDGLVRVWTKDPTKGGEWIADVMKSSGAILEWQGPCAVRVAGPTTIAQAIDFLLDRANLRTIDYSTAGKLKMRKAVLGRFNARSRCWR